MGRRLAGDGRSDPRQDQAASRSRTYPMPDTGSPPTRDRLQDSDEFAARAARPAMGVEPQSRRQRVEPHRNAPAISA